MNGAASVNLPRSVAPGELVDVSINLKSPATAGTFRGDWKVRDDRGVFFVHRLWVQIKVQAAAPPPPPTATAVTIYKSGSLAINQTFMADLDEGVITLDAARDVWFEAVSDIEKYLTPQSGVSMAVFGNSAPSRAQCLGAALSNSKIPLNSMPVGTHVCYVTNQGRPGVFRVNSLTAGEPQTLTIGYTTWNTP